MAAKTDIRELSSTAVDGAAEERAASTAEVLEDEDPKASS
jgi:hypothetical protein